MQGKYLAREHAVRLLCARALAERQLRLGLPAGLQRGRGLRHEDEQQHDDKTRSSGRCPSCGRACPLAALHRLLRPR